ncbi:hypothetical protein ACIRRA_09700 [Nocardia sp. NPDC101769]|uniref:hypothetical protein n=1 Tax=Nocardia sp. NPDC101769 TaxID=3364333 RepID=UPI00382D7569
MPTTLPAHVAAAIRLTARWCAATGTGDFALSGCGVRSPLALPAAAAAEPGRRELATATGSSAGDGHDPAMSELPLYVDRAAQMCSRASPRPGSTPPRSSRRR